ncbi:MAG TPA: preprotein translocase subunit YajC [Candidatus Koribacter sp.]|jgi:preprotein translocase subunit YajC
MTNLFALYLQAVGGASSGLIFMVAIFAIFYFLLIMPQQRRQKKWQKMLGELKAGDKIITTGGLRGVIFSVKDDALIIRVAPDNLKLEVTRQAIASVITEEKENSKS